ncbi:MAG: hypothetical protein WD738_01010 [Pirellulales bacterium]
MAARQKPSFEERVAEYVDGPQMTQRVRYGKVVSARILGSYGVYRTQVSQSKKLKGECTCPSELWPCKHVHALRATWEANPQSFFDLDGWLKKLAEEPKESLVEAIRNMVVEYPGLLSVFGVPGFDEEEEKEQYYQ